MGALSKIMNKGRTNKNRGCKKQGFQSIIFFASISLHSYYIATMPFFNNGKVLLSRKMKMLIVKKGKYDNLLSF